MTHILKLSEDYIEPVLNREKTFEVRFNDRGFQKGDLIKFTAISRHGVPYMHEELENKVYEITYVHSGLGLKEGYVVLGIKEPTIDINGEYDEWEEYKCSKCGFQDVNIDSCDVERYKFCPNCGAKMEGPR